MVVRMAAPGFQRIPQPKNDPRMIFELVSFVVFTLRCILDVRQIGLRHLVIVYWSI